MPVSRRSFLATASSAAAATTAFGDDPVTDTDTDTVAEPVTEPDVAQNEPPKYDHQIGFIGTGIRFHTYLGWAAMNTGGPCRKIADVDAAQAGRAWQKMMDAHRSKDWPINMTVHEDYQDLLDDREINAVIIGSPDHWHTKQVIDAVNAGKDVYCEKPLTLTIDEGRLIEEAIAKTGRIVQVGTQQRTEFESRFVKAAAIVKEGRLGDIKKVTCCIGGSRNVGVIPKADVPTQLNWDKYLGQCPVVDYREAADIQDVKGWGAGHPFGRAHHYYRWWYEYSGGKLTDWGAHHVDIAMLALGKQSDDIGLIKFDPIEVNHPVPFVDGYPTLDDQFNAATSFHVQVTFEDGLVMDVRNSAVKDLGFDNGVMFEGEKGRMLVNRGKLVGKPVEDLEANPLSDDPFQIVHGRPNPGGHMRHFFNCIETREQPISDVKTHNVMLNICHAINIAMRLGRPLTYDPAQHEFVDDAGANEFIARKQRAGYEITV